MSRRDRAGAGAEGEAQGWSLPGLSALVQALDARDLDKALALVTDDVRLEVEGTRTAVVGKDAVADLLRTYLDQTADSRLQVHFSSQGEHRARQEITLAAVPLPPRPQSWTVVTGTAVWEVDGSGLVRAAEIAVDRDAWSAQWLSTAALPAGSFRSDLALASFDPDEVVRTKVSVLREPAPPRRRPAARGALAVLVTVGVLAAAGVAGTLAFPSLADRLLGRDEVAGDGGTEAVEPAPSATPTADPPASPAAPPTPDEVVDPGTVAPTETSVSQEPGLSSGVGEPVVEEDDGTQVLSLSDQVLFDPGSATLSSEAGAVLTGIADRLAGADGELVVVGHTDDIGAPADNDRLAAARAEAVAGVITARLGPGPLTIVTSARGAREPVASNDSAEGRAANRRVELRFTPAP